MRLSARNQLRGKIVSVQQGIVNALVTLDANGVLVSANITKASAQELGLEKRNPEAFTRSLALLGADAMLIPALCVIILSLLLLRARLDRAEEAGTGKEAA